MAWQNFRRPLPLLAVGLSIELLLAGVLPIQVRAQVTDATSGNILSSRSIGRVTFEPPSDGQPENTTGGASRGGKVCPQDAKDLDPSLTLLKPANYQGLTVAEHPTFFVYVPQTSAKKALFVLKDESEDYYYQKTLPIPSKAGVVDFKLPADAPALKLGKNYQWSVVLICGEAIRPDSPAVVGQIRRIELNSTLSSQLKNLSSLDRAALYGKNGIWYDTIATLAQLRRDSSTQGIATIAPTQPDDPTLAASWEELLKSVGLEAIATKPLL
jgi:hypothetical protein